MLEEIVVEEQTNETQNAVEKEEAKNEAWCHHCHHCHHCHRG